nr:unnamed protein product [Callosobruchus chinensis]
MSDVFFVCEEMKANMICGNMHTSIMIDVEKFGKRENLIQMGRSIRRNPHDQNSCFSVLGFIRKFYKGSGFMKGQHIFGPVLLYSSYVYSRLPQIYTSKLVTTTDMNNSEYGAMAQGKGS